VTHERLPAIYVAYRWKDTARWEFLRDTVKGVLRGVDTRLKTLGAPEVQGRISGPNRLRSVTGRSILESIQERLTPTTILIADVSHDDRGTANPNVLLEVGMARARGTQLFLVAEKSPDQNVQHLLPSDLSGYYLSTYTRRGSRLSFSRSESAAFRMSLTGAVLHLLQRDLTNNDVDDEQSESQDDSRESAQGAR
jgi:hypothetical protein